MKYIQFLTILFCLLFTNIAAKTKSLPDFTQFVNPLIGSDSNHDLSNGNTYPAIALPWGMNFWTPQTNKMSNPWLYQYNDTHIRGFRQIHQPSPWIGDYGAFSIFATTDKLVFDEEKRASVYSHKAEVCTPYFYSAYLADYNTTVAVTPTERAAFFQISYPTTDKAYFVLDAFFKKSYVKVIPEKRKLIGYSCNSADGTPGNFKNYFVIYLDTDIDSVYTVANGEICASLLESKCEHTGAILKLKTTDNKPVNVRIASSFISWEQAEVNLQSEIGDASFETIKQRAKTAWNEKLSRIEVAGGTESETVNFYSALYRTMLFPRKFYEFNAAGEMIHYSPYNGKIEKGYMFTDNGFWDTFRAVFPFFTLMFPDLNEQIMAGLANTYKQSGWLPEWASPGHRDCMIGSNSASLIADSYLKGIKNDDIEVLYEAILKNANNEGPMNSVGRYGVKYYNTLGYIPYNVGVNENTARTLEYSANDFCIAKLAKVLNKPASEVELFEKRAQNYRHVFDSSTGFMRGKNTDGTFQSPFRADKWGDAFTEGCAWHWTWCVFHDPKGLINLMGGNAAFNSKLDSVFVAAPTFDYSYYGRKIHEITEMQIVNMGQYAHGNQPIQHAPYLYNYSGQPWKSQAHVREICKKLYRPTPDGLCGDEDNGQTSAWYVFSALGFYPVSSATGEYVLGSPVFKKATLHLQNGKIIQLNAPSNSTENAYVKELKFNNKSYQKNYLNHADLMKGCTLNFKMDSVPNYKRGINASDSPYSVSK